jgi:hypothetical protein
METSSTAFPGSVSWTVEADPSEMAQDAPLPKISQSAPPRTRLPDNATEVQVIRANVRRCR